MDTDIESLKINGTISDINSTNSLMMNGNYSTGDILEMNGDDVHETPVEQPNVQPKSEGGAPTYADAFPPLPAAPPTNASNAQSAWSSNRPKVKQPTKQQVAANKPILTSITSQVFKIPYEERKYKNLSPIVGDAERQTELILGVMQKTGTKIEVSVTKDQGLTIMISGKRDATSQARRLVIAGLQTQASIEMVIPKEHHRFILGKGGKKLQEIELSTQTRITLPRDSDIVRIVGTKEGIDIAKHEMQTLSDEQAKLAFERLNIPKIYHPFICGPDNEKAKEIANMSGARINIPPPSVMKDELTVAGDKECVQKAVKVIMDIYKRREKHCKTVSVEVKKSQHRYVIGARGSGIQDILRRAEVSVEMPSLDSDNETITIRGDPDKLGNGLTLVYERANSIVSTELDAPRWLHRFVIGRKGDNIKKITQDLDSKVHVEFVEDKDKILIEGPPADVQTAESLLSTALSELQSTMSYADINIDPRWHRHIIGKNGANITQIKKETNTSINVPSDQTKSGTIRIEGSPEGVAEAKARIMDMAKKMDNEKTRDIIIEHRFHKNIIGQKGEKVHEIREKFSEVQISFPNAESKSDVVSLRGPRDDVDKCFTFLTKMVNELTLSSYRLDVPIFKRFHGNIIGRNGASIKKIKEETGTIIDIPAENSTSDIIVITGKKENTHKARDMIMAIQNELANIVTLEVKISQKLHTSMIGPGGKLIQSIMTECGDVHIRFPPEGTKSDVITLRGTKEDVEKAEIQLKKLGEERLENSFTDVVNAKPEHHRFLIGRGGINIRKVREKTGARIIFPTRQDENQECITIMGKKEAVAEAKQELMSKIKDLNNVVEGEVMIDKKHHKYFATRKGQVLKDVIDEYGGVQISMPKEHENSNKFTLKGAKDCVEGAKARLLEIVNDLESMIEVKCVIAQKHHRGILGNKGKNVQDLTSRLNVQIKFPDRRRNDEQQPEQQEPTTEETAADLENKNDIIVISGKKENVHEAREALMALVPVSVEITIPFENHRFIIGQKGAGIRKMMDEFDVNISVPPADKKDDIIIVTGPQKHVDSAMEALRKRNDVIEAENEDRKLRQFELVVDVANKYHSKLIGRRGAVIQKLRDEHGVNIQVPPTNSSPEDEGANQIRLIGYKEKCENAKAAIDAIIKELEDQVSLEVEIDNRCHSRIIGQKGKSVRKLMDQFKVDIRFPRQENPDLVIISGLEDNCEACKEHLHMLEEEYMDDVMERLNEKSMMDQYMAPRRDKETNKDGFGGFVVADAPWNQKQAAQADYKPDAAADFPSLCEKGGNSQQGAWGPWK